MLPCTEAGDPQAYFLYVHYGRQLVPILSTRHLSCATIATLQEYYPEAVAQQGPGAAGQAQRASPAAQHRSPHRPQLPQPSRLSQQVGVAHRLEAQSLHLS